MNPVKQSYNRVEAYNNLIDAALLYARAQKHYETSDDAGLDVAAELLGESATVLTQAARAFART